METFFTATLTNDTPIFLGGYDTQYARDGITEGLRAQSLKGLIRYWMRVYLASAGYDLENIKRKVNELLGGKIGNNIYASKIKINCNDNMNINFHTLEAFKKYYNNKGKYKTKIELKLDNEINNDYREIPRIALLSQSAEVGKSAKFTFAGINELKSTVVLSERITIQDDEKILVIGSLITGLLLSGLGKMNRRGFGCFRININEDLTNKFKDDINKLFSVMDDKIRIDIIKNLIRITKEEGIINKRSNATAPIHSFDPKYCKIFYVSLNNKDLIKEIASLQRFTTRSKRAEDHADKLGLKGKDRIQFIRYFEDRLTQKHEAWFMGLPRNQKGTGYFADVERRASAMFISVHDGFALFTFFESQDWPNYMTWKGKYQLPLTPNIDDAFDTTIKLFKSYMKMKKYKYEMIWGENE